VPSIASDALPVLVLCQGAFSPPVFARAQLLAVAAILTTGRRTVSNLLRTLGHLAQGPCPAITASCLRPAGPACAWPPC
jgi:hypothetical protein